MWTKVFVSDMIKYVGLAPWPNFMGDSRIRGNLSGIGFIVGDHWRDVRLIQHELSHNYGARDASFGYQYTCGPPHTWTGPCITRDSRQFGPGNINNLWCIPCQNVIRANRWRH